MCESPLAALQHYTLTRVYFIKMESPLGPKPTKAYKSELYLGSRQARNIRVLCEMGDSEGRLADAGVEGTVLFFGSAR